jgi:hypothetical protein
MICATYTADTSYSYVIHVHFIREYFFNTEIFCHNVNINNQGDIQYFLLRILTKPEEFQMVIHTAFVKPSGIADLNSNGNITKDNRTLVNEMITTDQQLSSHTCPFNQTNHIAHIINTKTLLLLLNTTFILFQ